MSPDALSRNREPFADRIRSKGPRRAVRWLQSVAFWVAVGLPLVYLPMIALGLASEHPLWFVCLLGVNALSLALGHPYEQSS